ncbi:IS66 family insertion sequence element accessory protein TnpB [Desulfosediminicola ganghwensis]|uniref:IS66 family insertion sequence element accessory protein TnpB n=1 Tax=Desulfosediminicola ganghwensis TaxID=2569540 RepID=UPI0010AC8FB6
MYTALDATDMRKSIDGLSILVEDPFGLDLFPESLFAFCNRRRELVKILYWNDNDFFIWMKGLGEDIFR